MYVETLYHYVWKAKAKLRHCRKRAGQMVSLIYSATISRGEHYRFRQLLNKVRGPTLYQALRKIEDFIYPTFKSAAVENRLL